MTLEELKGFVWLNGRITAAARARISVFDRGFLYGDGLFETVRCYRGRPFALDEHLWRLERSAEFLELPVPNVPWHEMVHKLLAANKLLEADASVRITVTRGPAAPGLIPPAHVTPTVMAFALPVPPALAEQQRKGIRVVTVPVLRSGRLSAHKLLDYVPAILARIWARNHGAEEAIYIHQSAVCEATTANVFALVEGTLVTPPTRELLPGVTRALVLELAREAGIRTAERQLRVDELTEAAEVFLTSAVVEVLPVVRVNDHRIAHGKPGPLARQLLQLYRQRVNETLAAKRSK